MPQLASSSAQPAFQPNARAAACTSHGRAHAAKPCSMQNMRSRKRAESDRISWPRRLSRAGVPSFCIAARSLASRRLPRALGSARNAVAMIGLIVEAGIASWKTAALRSASAR